MQKANADVVCPLGKLWEDGAGPTTIASERTLQGRSLLMLYLIIIASSPDIA